MLTTDQVLGKGRYRIISNFTHDDTGGLYEAYDTVSNTNVVLRETVGSNGSVMTPAQLDEINNAFAGEARSLSEVRHGSLLNVQDFFSEIDRQYLVMEPVDGCDLNRFLQPEEDVPALGDVIKWADQILDALDYLHTLPDPIIHRDIRPLNIRLNSNFKVKLLTAGIGCNDVIMASASHSSDSSVLNYRPLEQLWGGLDPASQKVITNSYDDRSRRILQQPLDARSDIYSVGATLYHVITRTLPKDALERSIEILDGNSDPLVPPAELDPSIPEEISEVLMKALEIHREHRYDSAAIMRQVLNSAQQKSKSRMSAEPKTRVTPERLNTQTVEIESPASDQETDSAAPEPDQAAAPTAPIITPENVESPEEIERKRAEQRRLEIEADLERERHEAERIKAAESQAAAPKEDLLLEVEPVKTVDEIFEWSVEVSEQPSRKEPVVKPTSSSSNDIDFNLPTSAGSNLKFVAAGAGALVVVVAILGWLFIGGSTPPEPPAAHSLPTQQAAQPSQEQAPVSTYTEANANTSVTVSADQTDQLTQAAEPGSRNSENRSAIKQKKPTPTPAKVPEKKKVTVDDLINDN